MICKQLRRRERAVYAVVLEVKFRNDFDFNKEAIKSYQKVDQYRTRLHGFQAGSSPTPDDMLYNRADDT